MKKIFAVLVLGAAMLTANAQYEGHKFLDNWSLGIQAGGVSPTTVPFSGFFNHTRAVAGLNLNKQVSPVLTFGAESMVGLNTTGSYTGVDNVTAMLMGHANLTNLFCGYKGEPRLFEIAAVGGAGINHYFGGGAHHEEIRWAVANGTTFAAKAGLEFLFNVGEQKAWTINVRPMIAWDAEGGKYRTQASLNVNNSVLELTAGVTYHFKSSNGKHYMTKAGAECEAALAEANGLINGLRGELSDKDAAIRDLEAEVNNLRNQKPQVVEHNCTKAAMEQLVCFRQGKSVIDRNQMPAIDRVASFLNNHKEATVDIKGYASPEGSKAINDRLSKERAEAVKNVLIKKYGIAADRIQTAGQGVGNLLSKPAWNRVSICTMEEGK